MTSSAPSFLVAALYKFVELNDHSELRAPLLALCEEEGIFGTLLLAAEGINGTVAGSEAAIRRLLSFLRTDPRLADLEHKESWCDKPPFMRLRVRLKKAIVTLGVPEVDPTSLVGTYVKADEWNALISDPDVVLIDTRNDYEIDVGSFPGAIDPGTTSFTEFPAWVQKSPELKAKKKVAMFCTGGIRCEKASSYLLSQGIDEVYHLEGGILKYLEEVPAEESLWQGECFVFDERVSLNHDLKPGDRVLCFGCGYTVVPSVMDSPLYIAGVCCPRCHDTQSPKQRARFLERRHQLELTKKRQEKNRRAIRIEPPSEGERSLIRDRPVLYSFRRCPYAIRARMAIRMSGVEVELREVMLREKPGHMLVISPKGTVPVLWLPDGEVIEESFDIMRWALGIADPAKWLPETEKEEAEVLALIERNDGEFKGHLDRYKYANRYDDADPEAHRAAAEAFLQTLEERLNAHAFLCSERRGLADVAICPFIRQFAHTDRDWFDQAPYPKLRAWLSRELSKESFAGVMMKYAKWEEGHPGIIFPESESSREAHGSSSGQQ